MNIYFYTSVLTLEMEKKKVMAGHKNVESSVKYLENSSWKIHY